MMNTASTKYYTAAETAAELRKALKAAFPGVKFSVRSKTYSGGASIDIGWADGPTDGEVSRVSGGFAGATFDGMVDLKSHHVSEHNGERVRWGADFVFTRRILSAELLARAVAVAEHKFGITAEVVDGGSFGADLRTKDYEVQRRIMDIASHMRGNGVIVRLK